MNGVVIGSVVSRHLHVELGDSSVEADISEFFVHVVVAGSRLILQNDSISFDSVGVSLKDLYKSPSTWLTPRICPWALLSFCCFLM